MALGGPYGTVLHISSIFICWRKTSVVLHIPYSVLDLCSISNRIRLPVRVARQPHLKAWSVISVSFEVSTVPRSAWSGTAGVPILGHNEPVLSSVSIARYGARA